MGEPMHNLIWDSNLQGFSLAGRPLSFENAGISAQSWAEAIQDINTGIKKHALAPAGFQKTQAIMGAVMGGLGLPLLIVAIVFLSLGGDRLWSMGAFFGFFFTLSGAMFGFMGLGAYGGIIRDGTDKALKLTNERMKDRGHPLMFVLHMQSPLTVRIMPCHHTANYGVTGKSVGETHITPYTERVNAPLVPVDYPQGPQPDYPPAPKAHYAAVVLPGDEPPPQQQPQVSAIERFCTECGKDLAGEAGKFCPFCGTRRG